MQTIIREYDAKLDSKRRLTIRNTNFDYYHVQEMNDGTIILESRELTAPFQISVKTLAMMDISPFAAAGSRQSVVGGQVSGFRFQVSVVGELFAAADSRQSVIGGQVAVVI